MPHPPQIPLLPDATRRLAAVDLDWDHVRAVDILAVLRSFVPQGGAIQRVVVYPSGALGRGGRHKLAMSGPLLGTLSVEGCVQAGWKGDCILHTAALLQKCVLAHACTSCSAARCLAC